MSGLHIHHKRNFHPMRWLLLLVVLALLGVYAYYGLRWYKTGEASPLPLPVASADASVDETRVTRQQLTNYSVAANEPRYFEIEDSLVKARVMKVGVTNRNLLAMPDNMDDVGWYEKSALPGSGSGAALLSGRNVGVSRDGVFSKLEKLKERDHITIQRGDGKRFIYEVRDVREETLVTVNKTSMKQMMQSYDPQTEGLNLITDSGKWIPKEKVFDHRILVRAVRIR